MLYTEEESISGLINRNEQLIKIKMPINFDELEKYNEGHNLECFHNLDIDVINAEIKALHHNALLFFEKEEIKEKLFNLVSQFAIQKKTLQR